MKPFKFTLLGMAVLLTMITSSGQQLFAQQTHREFPIGTYWTQPQGSIDLSDFLFKQLDSVGVNVPHLLSYARNGSNFGNVQASLNKAEQYGFNAIIGLGSARFARGGEGQRTRFHAEKVRTENDSLVDDKFDWHGPYEDFEEPPPPFGDPFKVLQAEVGVHSSGLMVKDPYPENEQEYNGNYYVKPRLRIPAIANPGQATDDVIRIVVKQKSTDSTIVDWMINEQDFLSGGSYNGSYIEFAYSYYWGGQNPAGNDTLPGFPLGEEQTPGTVTGIQIEVSWPGLVDCWLDYVMVDDEETHDLFANLVRQSTIKNHAKDFVTYPSLWRYEIVDEPRRDQLYSCGLLGELLKQAAQEAGVTEPGKGNSYQMVYLGLNYGAKGIIHFLYRTTANMTGIQAINYQGDTHEYMDMRANLIEDCTVGIDLQ